MLLLDEGDGHGFGRELPEATSITGNCGEPKLAADQVGAQFAWVSRHERSCSPLGIESADDLAKLVGIPTPVSVDEPGVESKWYLNPPQGSRSDPGDGIPELGGVENLALQHISHFQLRQTQSQALPTLCADCVRPFPRPIERAWAPY